MRESDAGNALRGNAPRRVEAQTAIETYCCSYNVFGWHARGRVTCEISRRESAVQEMCCAAMGHLMLRPRMQVSQVIGPRSFRVARAWVDRARDPAMGSRFAGSTVRGFAPPHVEAQNSSESI